MARFAHAAVCSPLTIASEIGLAVLRDGGNAVDAAIATNLALAVAYPHMCGVGGDLLAQVWCEGELSGLISAGRLPETATIPSDRQVPQRGIGAATVPGAPAGWMALAERYGTRRVRDLAEPAISLAREGIERSPGLSRFTERSRDMLADEPETAGVFLALGRLVQTDLAKTLERIEDFYEGVVASSTPRPFTPEDFAAHRPEWVRPLRARFVSVEVFELPPPSRGHLALEAIRRLEPLEGISPHHPEFHLRLIRALRSATLGGDTIYCCVVDSAGMAVSLNQSLYGAFGSGVLVPGTGVLLHNRGAYLTPETYRGGARPAHTLSPGMALDDGRPRLVFGTMGGDAQIQIHLQVLARILAAGQAPEEAISAPRWIFTSDHIVAEEGIPTLDPPHGMVLRSMGFQDSAGHAHCILVEPDGLRAACDPRADGAPVGF